jgi:hypothetical protein
MRPSCPGAPEAASTYWLTPTRRRIIALLALGARRPSKVAEEIGLSWPATTRQLRLLQRARPDQDTPLVHRPAQGRLLHRA